MHRIWILWGRRNVGNVLNIDESRIIHRWYTWWYAVQVHDSACRDGHFHFNWFEIPCQKQCMIVTLQTDLHILHGRSVLTRCSITHSPFLTLLGCIDRCRVVVKTKIPRPNIISDVFQVDFISMQKLFLCKTTLCKFSQYFHSCFMLCMDIAFGRPSALQSQDCRWWLQNPAVRVEQSLCWWHIFTHCWS